MSNNPPSLNIVKTKPKPKIPSHAKGKWRQVLNPLLHIQFNQLNLEIVTK